MLLTLLLAVAEQLLNLLMIYIIIDIYALSTPNHLWIE